MKTEPPASRRILILLAALTAYFVILSAGPTAYSRFRVPVMPLLAIGAGRGWQHQLYVKARGALETHRRGPRPTGGTYAAVIRRPGPRWSS
jgi:hypothetical protein